MKMNKSMKRIMIKDAVTLDTTSTRTRTRMMKKR